MGSLDKSGKPFDLVVQLVTCIDEYEEDRKRYWQARTDGGDWGMQSRLLGHAESVATALLADTHDLIGSNTAPDVNTQFTHEQQAYLSAIDSEITSFMNLVKQKLPKGVSPAVFDQYINHVALDQLPPSEAPLLKLVWERLCIHLADDFAARVIVAANRVLQLSNLLVSGKPSDDTVRFLRRISRCFIWGFDAECVILCRGAIDTAFTSAVPDATCDKHGLVRASFGHTLTNRIRAALLEGIIDDETKRAAFRVNTPATEAAHRNPDEAIGILGVIQDTRDVLQRLVTTPSS